MSKKNFYTLSLLTLLGSSFFSLPSKAMEASETIHDKDGRTPVVSLPPQATEASKTINDKDDRASVGSTILSFFNQINAVVKYEGFPPENDVKAYAEQSKLQQVEIEKLRAYIEEKDGEIGKLRGENEKFRIFIAQKDEKVESISKEIHALEKKLKPSNIFKPINNYLTVENSLSSPSSERLKQALHADLAWQIWDNFKIPTKNVEIYVNIYDQYGDIFNLLFQKCENKKFWAGVFHPNPLVRNSVGNDPICKKQGGWDDFWPIRLSRVRGSSFTKIAPHQVDIFDVNIDKPILTQESTTPPFFWSLILDNGGVEPHESGCNEAHKAFATFHIPAALNDPQFYKEYLYPSWLREEVIIGRN